MQQNHGESYTAQKKKIADYLGQKVVATLDMMAHDTSVPVHSIRRMIKDKMLTTSLNFNHGWLILTTELRKRRDHWGFYIHRERKWSRTIFTFHVKRTTKATLSYLASKRPWGVSEKEADELLGRSCSRPLKKLKNANAIQVRLYNGELIYVNRRNRKADLQMDHRRTNPRFKKDDEEENEKPQVITFEELCRTFTRVLENSNVKSNWSIPRMCATLLMFQTSRTTRTNEMWIAHNPRIKEAMGLITSLDHTTLWRAFDQVDEGFLRELFHTLVIRLHGKGVIKGKFLVVDATHIFAYCNTKKDTDKNPVEEAAWGYHQGSFYGYKVHLLVDSESELPMAMAFSSGEKYDSDYFVPLMNDFEERYDFNDVLAVLADAAYDVKDFRPIVQTKTGGVFLPACNPRRSKIRKTMRDTVRKLFKKHGEKIKSVQDAFRYLGQKFLTDFDIVDGG